MALGLAAGSAFAQTTGDLMGQVSSDDGSGVPGVVVSASSPALQGSRATTTDGEGAWRLAALPPGTYELRFELAGFATESRSGVAVSLGRDSAIDIVMRPATAEEITVVGEVATIDVHSTDLGSNFSSRSIENLPSGRNYSSLVQVTPGVSSDANPDNPSQATLSVYGSSGAENTFYIDGVNTTGIEYGFQGKELNFEFIQEIEVKAGGYEAEYGKSTGGIISVITKSGGNEFRGDLFGYLDNDSLQASAEPIVSTSGSVDGFRRQDYGFDLGGYLVRDRLWFFFAYDKVSNTTDLALPAGPQAGQLVASKSDRDLGSVKLTYNLASGQSLVGTFFQDPREDTGAISDSEHSLNGEPSTYLGKQNFGGRDAALRWDGVFGSNWVANAQIARHREENSIGPATAAGAAVEYRNADLDFFQTGGFGLTQDKQFTRDFFGGSVSRYLPGHEIKLGAEYEKETADVVKFMSGGQRIDVTSNPVHPSMPIYRHFYWTTPTATIENAPLSRLDAAPEHKNTALYLQDRWSALPNLTVNLGVRWDRQQIYDRFGVEQIDLKKDYAPRLGLIWDPSRQGRQKVYGSWGRYYEQIPMDLVIRSFSLERQARIFNYDPVGTAPDAGAEADGGSTSGILGGYTEPADPNLRNQYMEETIVGYERELRPDLSVGVKGIWRSYGRVIEDFLCIDDGTYCIGNPGEGIMKEIYTYDYSRTLPAPKAKRAYKGIQIDVNKRLSNDWQLLASYLWSKLDGNYDGEFSPFTNVGADPNISAAYDYYDFFTNGSDLTKITNRGPLSNDRRHQLRVSGYYLTPWKLSIGATAYWRTGTPVTRYGYSDGYGRYEFFLTERGGEGRTPDTYDADLHLGYPVALSRARLNFLLDIFNVFNTQRPILLDQRWGFQEADNASPTPVNPNYGKPVLRTPPTTFRIGVRLSF